MFIRHRLCCFIIAITMAIIMPVKAELNIIKLATTTSTDNSGLLTYLMPIFERQRGYQVHIIATGTGRALQLGSQGDVDVVITHAPALEAQFVDQGFGVQPRHFMENDFVILAPKGDPAKINSSSTARQAFSNIAKTNQIFVSRGDNSGTHLKELSIWDMGIAPEFEGYTEVGQGMGKTLQMANELQAYTLADRGTFLAFKHKLNLNIGYAGDSTLANPYQIILINPNKYPDINYQGALSLSDWLISAAAQKMINTYQVDGTPLFKATYGR